MLLIEKWLLALKGNEKTFEGTVSPGCETAEILLVEEASSREYVLQISDSLGNYVRTELPPYKWNM